MKTFKLVSLCVGSAITIFALIVGCFIFRKQIASATQKVGSVTKDKTVSAVKAVYKAF